MSNGLQTQLRTVLVQQVLFHDGQLVRCQSLLIALFLLQLDSVHGDILGWEDLHDLCQHPLGLGKDFFFCSMAPC
jgi:hypothetical protein